MQNATLIKLIHFARCGHAENRNTLGMHCKVLLRLRNDTFTLHVHISRIMKIFYDNMLS